ncbi:AAA-ATPase [Cinnamomum micranthum f. kanehirae]|uniref:AAA-ATPase n=1 Tax=Cinnamomum micranthum f. kanehirae TaxID=337451 RepID=A0A3S3PYK3_9MAGN|nr:AAA-ATPase [Cinnamomum micranthum f. kanehirae]
MKEYWTSLASFMGAFVFFQTLMQSVVPPEIRCFFAKIFSRVCNSFSSYCYFDITEIDGVNTNELYNAVQLYLSNSPSITSATHVNLTRHLNSSAFTFGLSSNDRLLDSFSGAAVVWEHVVTPRQSPPFSWRSFPDEKRRFTLRIHKKDKPLMLESYLDHIMERATEIRRKNKDRLLYTNSKGGSMDARGMPWESVPFKHPSTFDTLAMDPNKKLEIMADLRSFADGQDFYQKTGRAWKRGYLLYGPPGTGKSSMIAAMANYLGYDIFDLELTEVVTNSELRKLLMKTTSKSIIVIEDIDCSINLTNRSRPKNPQQPQPPQPQQPSPEAAEGDDVRKTITLSGLLNFTDGLWSCCGSERIFVFTTNHIEKLDPALLRCGRMDMHIHMSFCTFPALKILEVVDLAAMTPADISEVLIKNRMDREKAVSELLNVLREKAERQGRNTVEAGGKNSGEEDEEEEQEKRALESPKEGNGFEEKENCEKVGIGGEEIKED